VISNSIETPLTNIPLKFFMILLLVLVPFFAFTQEQLTYSDLLNRLTDMEYLATSPQLGEKSGNFSSYDRRARYDKVSDTYLEWDSNRDGTGFIREEEGGKVVFEKDGPGVIWRVWSALAMEGRLKIYIDEAEEPVINESFRDFFDKLNDGDVPKGLPGVPSINLPNLMPTLSRGRNRFIPIPFNKHCRIVFEEGWGMYYHITYTVFPPGTTLPVFDGRFDQENCVALAELDRKLANRGYQHQWHKNETIEQIDVNLPGQQKKVIKNIQGNRAINHLTINFDKYRLKDAAQREAMLENVWLRIRWDKEAKAAVNAPIGVFFGTFPDVYPYRAYPTGALPGSLYSNWFMPFSQSAIIELINKGDQEYDFQIDLIHHPLTNSANQLLRFHAKWHKGMFKEEVQNKGREIDWPLLVTKGKGRFCGVTLHIQNEWDEPQAKADTWWYGKWGNKSINWWWGEGDEKFFVDGEKFPSTFGTGSEDYIGYAWSAEPPFSLFDSPFATQPYTAIDGNGHTIVSRFHISDNIPFQKSFTAVIDKYKKDKWGENNICLFQAVAYWYLEPGTPDGY